MLSIFSDPNKKFLKKIEPIVKEINLKEKDYGQFSDKDLRKKTEEFREKLKNGSTLDEILPDAFAVCREAAKRTLKQRHFDVQLMGGVVLHQGKIAEMKTGEGKTLVATLPAYLNALASEDGGVHIVTVNDYLSRRDAVWMGQIYHFLGLKVGCLNHEASYLYDPEHTDKNFKLSASGITERNSNSQIQDLKSKLDEVRDRLGSFRVVHEFLRPVSRKEAYEADIVYGTNNEFGFDYLRDNLVYDKSQIVQRGYNFAIIDEIDSILIDEARTPLIISAPAEESSEFYKTFKKIADRLEEGRDYTIDYKARAALLTEEGIEKAERLLDIKDIYTEKGIRYVHHLESAVRAKALFIRDRDYVVKNGEVIIVDEFTGRLMPGRRWSEGLHQAIEAKEGVEIQKESRTLASITFQNYFRMYKKLSGMTGTAMTSAEEFDKVYKLETISIPTNKPLQRKDHPDLVFQTEKGKYTAIVKKIKELHERGQPVLVGTVSIEKNEFLSSLLKREGVPHQVLNAKHHEEEGAIIAQAGKLGKVTIATNMAGRGVDIILGGNPPDIKEAEKVRELGGLFVLGTERHEARRIDNQLRGRSGRQGDPGETQFYISLEDDLMKIFGSDKLKALIGKLGLPEDHPIENKMISNAIESAQSKIEGFNFDTRKHLLEYDDVINHQRKIIYERRRKILFSDDPYKMIRLQVIDNFWIDHLETMEYMRSSVGLRAYGQRDPLVEYKNEGIRLFRQMEERIKVTTEELIKKFEESKSENNLKMVNHLPSQIIQDTSHSGEFKKVGRNDPCPCGSGKKYKKCHGK